MQQDDDVGAHEVVHRPEASPAPRAAAPQCGGLRSIALVGSDGHRLGPASAFTVALGDALAREWPALDHVVVAVSDGGRRRAPYPAQVRLAIASSDISAYRRAADFLNLHDVDLVSVQHEDGLHGGPGGSHLLALLRELRMPVVTTLHSVAADPDRTQREVIQEIVRRSERVVVTTAAHASLLRQAHGVPASKLDHIPGGGHLALPAVARAYGRCFERARAEHAQRGWRMAEVASLADRLGGQPPLELTHLVLLTDDTGIRTGDRDVPADDAGYAVDDNARALGLMAMLEEQGADDRWTISALASRYLSFLAAGFDRAHGRFHARMTAERHWTPEHGGEDSHARAVWALGTVVGRARDRGRCELSAQLFRAALPATAEFSSPRAWAWVLLGLAEYQRSYTDEPGVAHVQQALAGRLQALFTPAATQPRPWCAADPGSEHARLAQALIVAGGCLADDAAIALGLRELEWLMAGERAADGCYVPLATAGRLPGQQRPVATAATVSACLTALRVTGAVRWAEDASRAFSWFLGANTARRSLYDPRTGACCDAVHGDRIDARRGADATLSFLLAATEVRAVAGEVGERDPIRHRATARGTSELERQIRDIPMELVEDARAGGHAVAPQHIDVDPES